MRTGSIWPAREYTRCFREVLNFSEDECRLVERTLDRGTHMFSLSRDWKPLYNGAVHVSDFHYSLANEIIRIQRPKAPPNSYPITETELKERIKAHSGAIFSSQNQLLCILQRHEGVLRKRWLKKKPEQKARVLKSAFPDIPTRHRPDIRGALDSVQGLSGQQLTATQEDAIYKWPYLNLEDLLEPENLLLLLHARAFNGPEAFTHADVQACRLGLNGRKIKTAHLPLYCMIFKGQDNPETYGIPVHASIDPHAYLLHLGGLHFAVDIGLLILEVQRKTYDVLLECRYQIFSDVPRDTLLAASIPASLNVKDIETTDTTHTNLAAIIIKSRYQAPATLDVHRLLEVIEAKCDATEDHAWSSQADPGYIQGRLFERARHRFENLPDTKGRKDRHLDTNRFWSEILRQELMDTFEEHLSWDLIHQQFKALAAKVPKGFQSFDPHCLLPEDIESIIIDLLAQIDSCAFRYQIQMCNAAVVSSEMSAGFIREREKGGRTPLARITPRPQNDYLGDLLAHCFSTEQDALRRIGVRNLVDEMQTILKHDPEQERRFSPFVWEQFSGLAFAANLCRGLESLFPWSSNFAKRYNLPLQGKLHHPQNTWMDKIFKLLNGDAHSEDAYLPLPIKKSLAYSINKAYTEQNVATRRQAEWNLDCFWKRWDKRFDKDVGIPLRGILDQYSKDTRRVMNRTLPFWAPGKGRPRPPTTPYLSTPRPAIEIPERPRRFTVETPQPKIKTRGTPNVSAENPDAVEKVPDEDEPPCVGENPVPKVQMQKRVLSVFRRLFHNDSPGAAIGEIKWKDFLHAMTKVGFAAEKQYGSVWHFTPAEFESDRGFHVHEPHPGSVISPIMARNIGRRLTNTYGWTGKDFGEVE